MKISEIKTRLNNELTMWFKKQCQKPFDDFYLFYLPANPEHNGGFIICKEQPVNKSYKLALNNRMNKGYTIDQAFNSLMPTINRLPIID